MLGCPSCGAFLKYDIASARLHCEHCKKFFNPDIFDDMDKDAIRQKILKTRIWTCPGCGAKIETADDADITAVCSYCGGNRIIFDKIKDSQRPDKIIPFKLTKEDCKKLYQKAARRAFLSPGRFLDPGMAESFRGIYMPYCFYDVNFECDVTAPVMKKTEENRLTGVKHYELFDMDAKAHGVYTMQKEASRQFEDSLSSEVSSFNISEEVPFSPGYLCGFYAETPSDTQIEDDHIPEKVEAGMKLHSDTHVGSGYKTDWQRRRKWKFTNYKDSTSYFYNLYPVWFMSSRKNDKITYSVINGASGQMSAYFPIHFGKLILFAAVLACVIFGFLTLTNVMLMPRSALTISFVLTAVAWYLAKKNYEIVKRRLNLKPKKRKKGLKILFYVLIWLSQLIVLPVGIAVRSANLFWYAVVDAAMLFVIFRFYRIDNKLASETVGFLLILVAWISTNVILLGHTLNDAFWTVGYLNIVIFVIQFLMTIRSFNEVAYRRPPQFNKKGGDDNA